MAEMLTFEYLREVQKSERNEKSLHKLDPGFYQLAREYLDRKKKILSKSSDFAGSSEGWKMQHAQTVIREIFNRRENKILRFALLSARSDVLPENMLPEEKKLFEDMSVSLKKFRKGLGAVAALAEHEAEGVEDTEAKSEPAHEEAKDGEQEEEKESKEALEEGSAPAESLKRIVFLESMPRMAGPDGSAYGPFEKNSVGEVPERIAEILLGAGKAKEIDQ